MNWRPSTQSVPESTGDLDLLTVVSAVAQVATAIAAIVAVAVAILGLRTWWIQLKGTIEYRLTHDLLKQTFELRDAIKQIRYGKSQYREIKQHFPTCAGETIEDVIWDEQAFDKHVIWLDSLLSKAENAAHSIQGLIVEAEVIWGPELRESFEPLINQFFTLQSVLNLHKDVISPATSAEAREFAVMIYQHENYDAILYSASKGNVLDDFDSELEENINLVTATVREHMRP